jgi:ABC-type Fe3+/spermidine/putrescine transport system ATPase subunit
MRGEIRSICRATGLTTVYVTHDQKEALSIADRIAIMRAGKVVQVGTPAELYAHPKTAFVAEFLGQANLIPGRIVERVPSPTGGDRVRVETAIGELSAFTNGTLAASVERVTLGIRPEQIKVLSDGARALDNQVRARLVETWFLGDSSEHRLDCRGQALRMVSVPPRLDLASEVTLQLGSSELVVLSEAN